MRSLVTGQRIETAPGWVAFAGKGDRACRHHPGGAQAECRESARRLRPGGIVGGDHHASEIDDRDVGHSIGVRRLVRLVETGHVGGTMRFRRTSISAARRRRVRPEGPRQSRPDPATARRPWPARRGTESIATSSRLNHRPNWGQRMTATREKRSSEIVIRAHRDIADDQLDGGALPEEADRRECPVQDLHRHRRVVRQPGAVENDSSLWSRR